MPYLAWAGSIPILFIPKGNNAPITILVITIDHKLMVIAKVSGHGNKKTHARKNPATLTIILTQNPMVISF